MKKILLNIALKIRSLRELKDFSQEAIAHDLGISQQAYQYIESGKTKIDIERADKIAKSLQIDLETLLSFQPANYLNNCTQSGVIHTNNLIPDKMIRQMERHIENLQAQIVHLREQNKKLLDLVSNERDR